MPEFSVASLGGRPAFHILAVPNVPALPVPEEKTVSLLGHCSGGAGTMRLPVVRSLTSSASRSNPVTVRIEAQFTALRYFALDGTEHRSHMERGSMIRRYIIWRNRHADNARLRHVVARAKVA